MSIHHNVRNFAFACGTVCLGASGTAAYYNHDLKTAQHAEAAEQVKANKLFTEACPLPSNDFEPACRPGTATATDAAIQKVIQAHHNVQNATVGYAMGKEVALDSGGLGSVAGLIAAALAPGRRKSGEKPEKKSQWER